MAGTRILAKSGGEVLAVRQARLRVVRGRDARAERMLGEQQRAVIGSGAECDLVLRDDAVSRRHAEVALEEDGWVLRDLNSRNGVLIGGARVHEAKLEATVRFRCGETELEAQLLDEELEVELSVQHRFGSLVGSSALMRALFMSLERAAESDSTVLLQGESGTGKELAAEAIHRSSARAEGPFVIVDCGALPSTLIESELFGHEKGAYSGASALRKGAFELAHGGTLFIDEIGELPLELQPKLLRALESRDIRRVGSETSRPVDLRVVAATHVDLSSGVRAKTFREDLYYRLAVLKFTLPPLRQRREDIPMLAQLLFSQTASGDATHALTPTVLAALKAYDWPGNVRELRNVIERLGAMGDLATDVNRISSELEPYGDARRIALEQFERQYCERALEIAGGVVARAAERAGVSRQLLYQLLGKHGIPTR